MPFRAAPTPTPLGAGVRKASAPNAAALDPPGGDAQGAPAPRPQAQPHDIQHAEQHPGRNGHINALGRAARGVGVDLAPAVAPAAPDLITGGSMATGCISAESRMSAAAAAHSAKPPAALVPVPQQHIQGLDRKVRPGGGGGGSGGGSSSGGGVGGEIGPSCTEAPLACGHQLPPMDVEQPYPGGSDSVVQYELAGHRAVDRVPLKERGVAAADQLAGIGVAAGAEQLRDPVKVEATEAAAATGAVRGALSNVVPARAPGADIQEAPPCAPVGAGAPIKQEPSWPGSPLGPRQARLGGMQPAGGGGGDRNSSGGLPNQGVAGNTRASGES